MSERRQDPLSGRWVAVAGERRERPQVLRLPPPPPHPPADHCPFCPGHEEPELETWREGEGTSWRARVVRNRFARLDPPEAGCRDLTVPGSLLRRATVPGAAEVVVEGPGHGVRLGEMPGEHLEAAVRGQFARLDALRKAGFGHVAVFRNQGAMAGASQPHPHSQLVASWDVPPALEQERRQFLDHRERTDRCLLCDLAAEEASGEREVGRRGGFVFLAPWAGAHPMELLLVPETCSPDLLRTEPSSWAAAQAWVDRLLQSALPGTASNLWVHHAPEEAATFHWHAHVVPRQDVTGGWELATGWQLEPLPPEQAAVFYREAWACLTAGSPA